MTPDGTWPSFYYWSEVFIASSGMEIKSLTSRHFGMDICSACELVSTGCFSVTSGPLLHLITTLLGDSDFEDGGFCAPDRGRSLNHLHNFIFRPQILARNLFQQYGATTLKL